MASPHRISKETETKLCRSLEKVAAFIADGDTPSEAIVKVARDEDMGIDRVQLLIQAHNNARYNTQRKSSSLLAEKMASFPLADPVTIFSELYPSNVKQASASAKHDAISDDYTRPPVELQPNSFNLSPMTKVASTSAVNSDLPRDPDRMSKKAHNLLRALDHEHDEKRRQVHEAREKVAEAFDSLRQYFKQAYRKSFKTVQANAESLFGTTAAPIFRYLSEESPYLLKESAVKTAEAVDHKSMPYTAISTCIEKASEYKQKEEEFNQFTKQAGLASYQLLTQFLPVSVQVKRGSIVKNAEGVGVGDILSGGTDVLGKTLPFRGSLTAAMPKETEKLEQGSLMSMMNPAHEQELRKIRAKAVFHNMAANDEYLATEHPDKLTHLYNEIARVSPRAVDQPLLMRALLRRYVSQGAVDPHDVEQLATIEGKLKDQERPSTALPAMQQPQGQSILAGPKQGQ